MSGLHNKNNWNEFIRLRDLIKCNPSDKDLLRQELRSNYYQQRLNSLSDLRAHMSSGFEDNFFNRDTVKFFGPHKYKFSKRDLTMTCIFKDRIVVYEIVFSNGNLILRLER